jgi:AraC-like DNA-binding protein
VGDRRVPADPRPTHVALVVGDRELERRVLGAVRGVGDVLDVARDLRDLAGRIRPAGERAVLILGSRNEDGPLRVDDLVQFRLGHPLVHVVLCLGRENPYQARLRELTEASMDSLVWLGGPERGEHLRTEVAERLAHVLPDAFGPMLWYGTWSRACATESWSARNAYGPLAVGVPEKRDGAVRSVATHFGVVRQTVLRRAQERGWEDAIDLVDAARCLHIAAVCASGSITLQEAARALGFGSASALDNLLHRCTGLSFGALRRAGALDLAVGMWKGRARLRR